MLITIVGCLAFVAAVAYTFEWFSAPDRLALSISVVFFGTGALVLIVLLTMVSNRDILVLSERGLCYGFYGLEIEWRDVGPAWIYSIEWEEGELRDVLFLVRRAPFYRQKLRWDKRLLFSLASRKGKSYSPEVDGGDGLDELRQAVMAEGDSVAIPLPNLVRRGLSNEETVEIINTVVLQRNSVLDDETIG